jgi:tRNA (guanine-N7-)-methyltransferase
MRIRKKPNLAARLEKCSHLLAVSPESLRGRWLSEFGYETLHVELGCGKGLFTAETAKAEPDVFIAALEKSADAMVIATERAAALNLQNIRFINAYADNLTDYFADSEVSRIYINFCDPWPSNRHAKRRLTCRRFLELYAQVLAPGGEIYFKTDNTPLFEYSLREFGLCGFEQAVITRDLHKDAPPGIMTDYELKFHSQGLPICRCVVRR